MEVKVKFLGPLKNLAGQESVTLQIGEELEPSILTVIRLLGERFGVGVMEKMVDPELNDSSPRALILRNNVEVGSLQSLKTQVEDRDVLVIIPVSHGG